jgi:hypothetical protein
MNPGMSDLSLCHLPQNVTNIRCISTPFSHAILDMTDKHQRLLSQPRNPLETIQTSSLLPEAGFSAIVAYHVERVILAIVAF